MAQTARPARSSSNHGLFVVVAFVSLSAFPSTAPTTARLASIKKQLTVVGFSACLQMMPPPVSSFFIYL